MIPALLVACGALLALYLKTLFDRRDSKPGELAALNARLEEKTRERTQALEFVNHEMARQNRELAERSEELARHRYREQAKGRALAALAAESELEGLINAALGEIAAPASAAVMICYQVEGNELVPIGSYAASAAARTTRLPLAGMAAQALEKSRIETLDTIPDELDLRFDCLLAAGRPRSLALLPLSVGRRQTGLLLVGSLGPINAETIATLSDLATPLALTIARRTLLAQTERIARELARRNEELREQATELAEQGEELKAQQRELEVKNREVEKADKLKSEFLANMSHELRTPLNAVIGFSELLLDETDKLAPEQVEYARDIHASGRHLLTLINGVLDLAKIEAGRMTLSVEAVQPTEAIASAFTLVNAAAKKKQISLELAEADLVPVLADPGKLQQILLNLLSNAIKFSPAGSRVDAGASRTGGSVRFFVRDNGPGLAASVLPQLFKPFFQAESPLVKKHEGTGLGLAISKRLVEQHGGTMLVESVEGLGATFSFTLPVAAEEPRSGEEQISAQRLAPHSAEGLVLVVDDHETNLEVARQLLERLGCDVLLARGGDEGLQLAREHQPALVLLDIAMPGKDGFALAAELKADPLTGAIPLVALTALAMRGDDDRVRQAGFDGYLTKPIDRRALEHTVAKFCVARRAA
jgi:signal transduction histidine kinase/ActR/RegA family two-component response regulator